MRSGHRVADVWAMSPRTVIAFSILNADDSRRRAGEQLVIHTLAARGDEKHWRESFNDWTDQPDND